MKMCVAAWTWVMALFALAVMGAPARAGSEGAPMHVTYTSGDVFYINVGEDDGLHPGDVVEIVRAGHAVGTLRILYVSGRSASGSLATGDRVVQAGDQVLFTRRGAAPAVSGPGSGEGKPVSGSPGAPSPARSARRSRGWFRDRGVDGRIGVGAMSVADHGVGHRRTLQQTVDLRVTGTKIGGAPLSLAVDIRTRQTERAASGDLVRDRQARVNLLSGSWRPAAGPFELSVGRQTAVSLGSIGVFDGVQVRYTHRGWQVGAISATRPAPLTSGLASDVTEHGLYARFESSRDARRRVSLGTGAIGSYRRGQVDREFVALQQGYDDARLSAYFSEELDVNRGWKREAGEKAVGVTNFYAHLHHRPSSRVSLTAGFDNRRNARLFRDRDVVDGAFDDTYRDGAWLGANARFRERFDAGCDARWSGLKGRDQNESYTLSLGAGRLWPGALGLRSRTTWFHGVGGEGWLYSLNGDLAPTSRTRVVLRGGTKQETAVSGGSSLGRYLWYGVDLDFGVGRHWYLLLSGERRREAGETIEQVLAKTTWRL